MTRVTMMTINDMALARFFNSGTAAVSAEILRFTD